MSEQLQIRGGAAGLEVQYDALADAARRLAGEGGDLLLLAASRHRLLVDGDLLASAVLDPGGFARVEVALVAALDGGSGLCAAAARLELRSGQLLVAVARYRAVEALQREAVEARRWLLGAAAPVLVPLAVATAATWTATVLAGGGDPAEELEQVLVSHPGLVEELTGAVGGLTAPLRAGLAGPLPGLADAAFRSATGETLLPRDLAEAAGLLALLYGPASPAVNATGRPDRALSTGRAPTGVGDLLERLHSRNEQARIADGTQGDIGVTRIRTQTPAGPRVAWIVDLPGTKDWQVVPGPRPGVNDLATNLELMAGQPNARIDAVARILRSLGAANDPVMLVGHSQGGMVAVRAATALASEFTVTHVVTAGSPVGGMPVPAGVQVLSLENRFDVVPYADGSANADAPNQITVTFEHQSGTVTGNHGIDTAYVPAARELDRTDDASVRAWLAGAEDFLAGRGEQVTATSTVHSVGGVRAGGD